MSFRPAQGRHHHMRFMLLYYVRERPEPGSPGAEAFFSAMASFTRDCAERGVLVASDPLREPQTATTVRAADTGEEPLVTRGPFAETAEWLGGYLVADVADERAAVALARECPAARWGAVEVRPLLPVG
jgi:hypothetical protein